MFDTGLNTLWSANWIRQNGSQRIIGSFNNAAVGTALGQANGVQALDRSRQVIALTGDGGFNMLMGEFMTAVHHKLPVKVVDLQQLRARADHAGSRKRRHRAVPQGDRIPQSGFRGAGARLRRPRLYREGARRPQGRAAARPWRSTAPPSSTAVVAADEMPNIPHIELEQVGNYAIAKIKEAVQAVCG